MERLSPFDILSLYLFLQFDSLEDPLSTEEFSKLNFLVTKFLFSFDNSPFLFITIIDDTQLGLCCGISS